MRANAVRKQDYTTSQNQWVKRRLSVVKNKADVPATEKYKPQDEPSVDFEEFLKQYGIKDVFA